VSWARFTKRTDDPKLTWLERKLDAAGIPNRRDGSSFHAPILQVEEGRLDDAWEILRPVDDIDDEDLVFVEDAGGCSCGPKSDGAEAQCAFCQVDEAVAKIRSKKRGPDER